MRTEMGAATKMMSEEARRFTILFSMKLEWIASMVRNFHDAISAELS